MSEIDPHRTVVQAFVHLRKRGVSLGMAELLAAMKVVQANLAGDDFTQLAHLLQLVWCKSDADRCQLEATWDMLLVGDQPTTTPTRPPSPPQPAPSVAPPPIDNVAPNGRPSPPMRPPELQTLPLQAPAPPSPGPALPQLHPYWPVSRRYMVFMWRYLRRPLPVGPRDVFDLDATIDTTARTGGVLVPVYRRRAVNQARLVLLLDHRGSMMPFHYLLRDLVETLRDSAIEQQRTYYFSNVPGEHVYATPYLTEPVPWTAVQDEINPGTSVLIVGDAGAARGRPRTRARPRVQATLEFLVRLQRSTRLVAWLNPMPAERWETTAAATIARVAPMFQMDEHGFSNAVDVLSGRGALR